MEKGIDYKAVAAQLARPSGEEGVLAAQRMNMSNGNMTCKAIDLLDCLPGQKVLEIGPGNGRFAPYVLEKATGICYSGTDISGTMIEEGLRLNETYVRSGKADFQLTDGLSLPYPDASFDRVFSVNTIYFWADPAGMAREILRVLKKDGLCCIAMASREFMQDLPFTDERFRLYDKEEAEALLARNGFRLLDGHTRVHKTISAAKTELDREEIFVLATI